MKVATPLLGLDLDPKSMLVLAGLAVAGIWLARRTLAQDVTSLTAAAQEAAQAVNPIDENNVINQAFLYTTRKIFGLPETWTLGTSFETPAEKAETWDPDSGAWIPTE